MVEGHLLDSSALAGLLACQFTNDYQIKGTSFELRATSHAIPRNLHKFYLLNFVMNLGPLHTRDQEPVTNTLQALSLVEKAEPVQVRFPQHLGDQRSMWMHDGCKVHMDSYMVSNGSCFMVTWTIFKNYLLEVGLIHNWEIMVLRTLTTVGLFYFIMCEDLHE